MIAQNKIKKLMCEKTKSEKLKKLKFILTIDLKSNIELI